ncbi:MAG: zinc ribbon domain-containing protein [Bacilli bacterium]|nr:zinc ribbon domain-containing protein [Bacilli bacterium]
MKQQKVLLILIVMQIIIPIIIFTIFGFDFTYWREVIGILSILFGFTVLMLLLCYAHRHDQVSHEIHNIMDFEGEEIEVVQCDNCNAINKKTALFCHNCNFDLRQIVCPICGNENPYNEHYCLNCDSILQNEKRHS